MPLLSKEVVVDAIEIKNLRANLVRAKDGKLSIDDLTGGEKAAPAQKSEGAPVRIDIDHVSLENATVTFVDQAAGAKYALSKLNLKTGRIANGVPGKFDLAVTAQSDKPKLNLDVALKTTLTFDLDKQHYVLEGLDFNAKGTAAGITNLVASAKGDVDAKLATRELVVSKLAVAATGKPEGGGDLNLKFDAPKLNVTKDKVNGDKIGHSRCDDDRGQSPGRRSNLEIPGLDGNAKAFTAAAMTLNLEMQKEGVRRSRSS